MNEYRKVKRAYVEDDLIEDEKKKEAETFEDYTIIRLDEIERKIDIIGNITYDIINMLGMEKKKETKKSKEKERAIKMKEID